MRVFLASERWFSFHLKMSSQQFADIPLRAEDMALHDACTEHRANK